ncbi:MAG: tetratricopeptide repeat protein, partial [Gammaproteobacteria bacterium]
MNGTDPRTHAAWRYRPGRIHGALGCMLLLGLTATADAGWFKTPEQEAVEKFEQGEYREAAEDFSDEYRRGVALYRAGKYTEAGDAFQNVTREEVKADALYNLGNSRFKRSDYEGAIEAYEQALELRADDEDTLNNLALAKSLLGEVEEEEVIEEEPESEPEEQQEEQQQESEEQQEEQQQESEEQSGEQEQESEEQSGEQEQESEEQSGEQEQESEEQSGEQEQESEEQSGEQEQEEESEGSGDQEQESEK